MNLRFFRHEKNWVYLGLVVRISQNMKRIFWKLSSASKSSLVVTIETPKIRYVLQVYFIWPQTAVHRSKVPIDTRLNVVIQSLLVTPIITPITNIEPNSFISPNSNLLFDFFDLMKWMRDIWNIWDQGNMRKRKRENVVNHVQ